jgi:transposase-like protein
LILRRHFLDKVLVSDLCDELGIAPTVFYRWQKQFFENGALTFERVNGRKSKAEAERIEYLEAKLRKKDEVLGELMEEHVALKKELGEP